MSDEPTAGPSTSSGCLYHISEFHNDAENDEEYPHKWLDEMEALERELIEPELTSGINP